ncbi:unnamed protein product [Closterium sp. NIES-53]
MYALSFSAEGDCYWCVPPDPGIAAAALGASASGTPPGTAPGEALNTFTLDSGASRCFFRDSTTLTPLPAPVPVKLADPSGGPVVASSSTVLPCAAVPSGSLSGLQLPSFSTNLMSTTALQDAMVTTTTPGGLSLYTLATEPPQVAASAQVSASGQAARSCPALQQLPSRTAPPCSSCRRGPVPPYSSRRRGLPRPAVAAVAAQPRPAAAAVADCPALQQLPSRPCPRPAPDTVAALPRPAAAAAEIPATVAAPPRHCSDAAVAAVVRLPFPPLGRPSESLTSKQLREWYASWGCRGGRSVSRPGVGSSGASGSGQVQLQRRPREALSPQQLREWYAQSRGSLSTAHCPYVIRTGVRTVVYKA